MPPFPHIKLQTLEGSSFTLPSEDCVLVLSFDKLQYPEALNWYNKIAASTSLPMYKVPMLSDRFMLMQDILFDGIKFFFKEIESKTYPSFINRIQFFEDTGLNEQNPIIIHVKDNDYQAFETLDSFLASL